jgi:hypothetical protein
MVARGVIELHKESAHRLPPDLFSEDGYNSFMASSREDQSAASDMREKSETPDEDTSEMPRGMIDNRLRF